MNIVKWFALANIQSVSFCQKLINIIDATNKELSMIRLEEPLSPNRVLWKKNDIKIKAVKDKIRFLQWLQQGKERQEERRVRDWESIATYNEQVLFELLSQVDKTKDGKGFRERQLETMMTDDESRLELAGQLVPILNLGNPCLSDESKELIRNTILEAPMFKNLKAKLNTLLVLLKNPELNDLWLTQPDLVLLLRAGVCGKKNDDISWEKDIAFFLKLDGEKVSNELIIKIRNELLRQYNDEKTLLHLSPFERLNLKMFWYALSTIGKKIWIGWNIANSKTKRYIFIEKVFLKKISEIDPDIIQDSHFSKELIGERLLALFTYSQLINLPSRDRVKLNLGWMGLTKIAKKLWVLLDDWNPKSSDRVWHNMLQVIFWKSIEQIYPSDLISWDESISEVSRKKVREELLEWRTRKELKDMLSKERNNIKACGMWIFLLWKKLWIQWNPLGNNQAWYDFLEKLLWEEIVGGIEPELDWK